MNLSKNQIKLESIEVLKIYGNRLYIPLNFYPQILKAIENDISKGNCGLSALNKFLKEKGIEWKNY